MLTPLHPEGHLDLVLHKLSHVYYPAPKTFGPSFPENQGWSLSQSELFLCAISPAIKQGHVPIHSTSKLLDLVMCRIQLMAQ